jgi:molybdate transport system ATP-binding protein
MSLHVDAHVRRGTLELAVTLTLDAGTAAVVGPNGAGKTTLLRCIAGLTPIDRGRIAIGDRVLDDTAAGVGVPTEHRRVGVVFQDYLLFPHRSALDNVAYGLQAHGVPRRQARARAGAWLDRVGLGDRGGDRPDRLSGGQAQRVALARALALDPDVLLLDEPLAALDVEARGAMRRHLHEHLAAFDGPALLVTHDPVEAATLADRLVVLEAGRVTQSGTVDEITRRPRSPWAARLAGVNLYAGTATARAVTLDGGGQVTVPEPHHGAVFVAVPPTAVALYRALPHGTPRNVWCGEVDGFDSWGGRVRVHVASTPPVTAEITPAAASELALARGGTVFATVKATEVSVYSR